MQTIHEDHCQSCGETDREYINPYSNYSSCCNEGIITPLPGEACDEIYCSHPDPTPEELAAKAEEARVQAEKAALIGTTVLTAKARQGRFTSYCVKGLGRRSFPPPDRTSSSTSRAATSGPGKGAAWQGRSRRPGCGSSVPSLDLRTARVRVLVVMHGRSIGRQTIRRS